MLIINILLWKFMQKKKQFNLLKEKINILRQYRINAQTIVQNKVYVTPIMEFADVILDSQANLVIKNLLKIVHLNN